MTYQILNGDVRAMLDTLEPESVHMVVTSPPYYLLRSYGTEPQIWNADSNCTHNWQAFTQCGRSGGLSEKQESNCGSWTADQEVAICNQCGAIQCELGSEPTIEQYVANVVEVFRHVRRVLHPSGTVWLNLGDTYTRNRSYHVPDSKYRDVGNNRRMSTFGSLPPKNLCMIPARVALALQADGWWLRSEIVLCKINPMPESVTTRPTNATERLYLLAKCPEYYYDSFAVREKNSDGTLERYRDGEARPHSSENDVRPQSDRSQPWADIVTHTGRNLRNWWSLISEPNRMLHFAGFPRSIPRKAILAGTSAYGACAWCQAPWRRMVDVTPEYQSILDEGHAHPSWKGERRAQAINIGVAFGDKPKSTVRSEVTVGWAPSCSCGTTEVVPCVVLDPFAGTGTTLQVAEELGRDSIGIELKAEYVEMIHQRMGRVTAGLPGLGI